MPAQHHARRRSRPLGLRTSRPVAVWDDAHNLLFSLSATDNQAPRTSFQESHQALERSHVLGIRLLHPSRKVLHCELQLPSVLTEVAGPHRPRSEARSTLSITFLAIVLVSHPNTREYSLRCFRHPGPSARPESQRVEGRPPARIAHLPVAPRGYSLTSLFRWVASCTSPIATVVPNAAVVLDQQVLSQHHLGMRCKATSAQLKEKSSLQRTNLTNVFITFLYPTQMLN